MIIYATRQTFERYKLKPSKELTPPLNQVAEIVIENERGDKILEWGAKLFYFNKRKCIQVVNFASKLTLFLFDVKIADIENIGNMIAQYLLELYKTDKQMIKALNKMFEANPIICFERLTDKSIIATLNSTQNRFTDDGYRFYEFIQDGILHTLKINHSVNFDWFFTMKIDGKTDYIYAGERFKEIVLERYGKD